MTRRNSKNLGQQQLQALEDFDVLGMEGFFLFYTSLRVSRQGVSSSISLPLTIVDLDVVTREFLGSADLFKAQTLYIHELAEIVMVDKHKNFMLGAYKVVLSSLESFNNG